jgi:hypothetical protein
LEEIKKKLCGKDFEEISVEGIKKKLCGKYFEVISVKKLRKIFVEKILK